ncbi:MAG: MerR family transcriptional regulator [Pseudomonadota bacterium]|nr:MerR family transcriptional regulator [Pseudomonadota bacterium]
MAKAETAYRTIAEVSELLQVQPSVLRFWETQFHQVKPIKRMGRRYYSAEDVVLVARIRDLLYKEGFTIKGVQKKLKDRAENAETPDNMQHSIPTPSHSDLISELMAIRDSLKPYLE